jgi:hypothetical protein
MNKPLPILSFVVFGLAISELVYAQKVSHFEGDITLNNKIYKATFDYFKTGSDTIFHGPFFLYSPTEVSDESAYFNFTNLSGRYKSGKPEGIWNIKTGRLKPIGGGIFKDYNYTFRVSGNESLVQLKFKEDRQLNIWRYFEWNIENSEVTDTSFAALINFGDKTSNSITIVNQAGDSLFGKINSQGFAEGTWQYFTVSESRKPVLHKEWIFENRLMTKKVLFQGGVPYIIDLTDEGTDNLEILEIDMSDEYFNIINLIGSVKAGEKYSLHKETKSIDTLVSQTLSKFEDIVVGMNAIFGDFSTPVIKIAVKRFPISENEIGIMDKVKSNLTEMETIFAEIQADPQINLTRLSNPRVSYFLNGLESINRYGLRPVRELISYFDKGGLEYLDRNMAAKNLLIPLDNIKIQDNEGSTNEGYYKINTDFGELDQSEGLLRLDSYVLVFLMEINSIKDSLEHHVFETRKEKKLVVLEGVLLERFDSLKLRIEDMSLAEVENHAGFDIKKVLLSYLDSELSRYSNLASLEEKSSHAEPLIDCFNMTDRFLNTLEVLPFNIKTIHDAYTKQVFNPYTFTNMEETIKPSIYNAFSELILPDMFLQIKSLECNSISSINSNFSNVFEGMIDLLKRDTRKEEKSLRRVKDSKRAAEILNLNLHFN